MFDLKFTFLNKQNDVLLELPSMSNPLKLSASGVDNLIRELALLRKCMVPSHELTRPAPNASTQAIRWLATASDSPGAWNLHLLHPGLGWISIALDRAALDDLVKGVRLVSHETTSRWCH